MIWNAARSLLSFIGRSEINFSTTEDEVGSVKKDRTRRPSAKLNHSKNEADGEW
jgi:hypothetical protein